MCIRDRDKVSAPTKREFIITGAKGSSIDKELYTEENVTEAIAKIKNANKAEERDVYKRQHVDMVTNLCRMVKL